MRLHRLHDGAEAGDGAGAQVIAIAEAAGQHDDVGALQRGVAMPDEVGLGATLFRAAAGVLIAVAAGKPDHSDAHHQSASTSTW